MFENLSKPRSKRKKAFSQPAKQTKSKKQKTGKRSSSSSSGGGGGEGGSGGGGGATADKPPAEKDYVGRSVLRKIKKGKKTLQWHCRITSYTVRSV